MSNQPAYGKAVAAMCRNCICDPADLGTWRQQVAACIANDCPLHPVRPIKARETTLPMRLLDHWQITPEQLDARARAQIVDSAPVVDASRVDERGNIPDPVPEAPPDHSFTPDGKARPYGSTEHDDQGGDVDDDPPPVAISVSRPARSPAPDPEPADAL